MFYVDVSIFRRNGGNTRSIRFHGFPIVRTMAKNEFILNLLFVRRPYSLDIWRYNINLEADEASLLDSPELPFNFGFFSQSLVFWGLFIFGPLFFFFILGFFVFLHFGFFRFSSFWAFPVYFLGLFCCLVPHNFASHNVHFCVAVVTFPGVRC